MKVSKRLVLCGAVAAAGLVALPLAAIASHGKAGLWNVTVTMDMNMAGMPQMPQMTPEQMQQMRSMGVQMPGMGGPPHTISTQHCMTAEEVNSDKPPPMREHECTVSNTKVVGQTFSADMTCNGEMQGSGHMTVTYDSTEHYSGKMDFNGTTHGHPANMSNSFEGRWVSADCGTVAH